MSTQKKTFGPSVALSVAEAVSVAVAGNDFPCYYSHVQIHFSRIFLLRKENEIRLSVATRPPTSQRCKVRVDYDLSPNHHQPAVTGWSREITINPYYLSFLSIARTRLKREGRIDRSWRYHSQPPRNNFSNYSLVRYPPEAQVEFLLLPRNNANQLFERGEIARHEQDHGQAGERNDADAN